MGRLSGPELTEFEEHLLVCETCQARVAQEDTLRQGIRDAAPVLESPSPARHRWPKLIWTIGFAAALLLIFGVIGLRNVRQEGLAPAVVLLQTMRGPEETAAAPAYKPLTLVLDITGLPPFATYPVEIVDDSGHPVSTSGLSARNSHLRAGIRGGLAAGAYFVRVYSPTREILREYSLTVK